jgi:hypothetical protein
LVLTLTPQIGELTNLETLNLSRCEKLKSFPDEIMKLKNLKVLDFTDTKIYTKDFQKAVSGCGETARPLSIPPPQGRVFERYFTY